MGLFGKTPERNPKDMVNEWNSKLRKEGYQLDRQIRAIKREEDKVKRTLKEAAKKNDRETCMILAKEVLNARKAINKIYTSKAHINSVMLQMKNQLATLRVAGSLSKSTEVMQAMQRLIRVPEVAQTMQDMSREMMKAGIIEEMLDETMDVFEDDSEEMEAAAQNEVDKVLWELTEGKLGEAPAPPIGEGATASVSEPSIVTPEVEDEEEIEEMQSRRESDDVKQMLTSCSLTRVSDASRIERADWPIIQNAIQQNARRKPRIDQSQLSNQMDAWL